MRCELCSEQRVSGGHSLCAACAEMVQRLIAVKERLCKPEVDEPPRRSGGAAAASSSR